MNNSNVSSHYENHLAAYYTRISGGFDNKCKDQAAFFEKYKIYPSSSGIAIDLGSGSGFQSVPLAGKGFSVYAVDFSRILLDELLKNSINLDVKIIESDICNYSSYSGLKPELIVCMGDTLTHLPDTDEVSSLIQNAYNELTDGGKLVLTFRDYSNPLTGSMRFIPVASGDDFIFTCFLDYAGDYVYVYDIVHERVNSAWIQKVSSYRKTVITKFYAEKLLIDLNFKIDHFSIEKGLVVIIAVK
ncbi:MAG: class I SAM-dependent methyltransferase [Spirochaetes bacterium]|nr:class I SAM-dependent methyltransferase [Spirochaetota bacterium]